MVPRSALALVAAAALAACAPDAPPSVEPPAGQPAPDAATQLGLSWTVPGAGQLALHDGDGAPLLTLQCAGGVMTATAPGLREIASEERFSLGADDQVFILVAQLGQASVRAEGTPSQDFLNRLPSANAVQANYGAQNIGPHIPPSPEQARDFVAACRS